MILLLLLLLLNTYSQARGYDTRKHTLACFGGAGGQHACAIARSLGISRVVIHKYAGILSAYGMACADVVHEVQEPCALSYDVGKKNPATPVTFATLHCHILFKIKII